MPNIQYRQIATPDLEVDGERYDHITIQNGWFRVSIHSVGVDDAQIDACELPPDPKLLRELASKLLVTADEIEKWRKANHMPV
jgi:hypothetical protein